MNIESLAKLFADVEVTDIHFRSGFSPIVRREGRLVTISRVKPATPAQIRRIAEDLMTARQREAFRDLAQLDFSTDIPNLPKLKVKFFQQRGAPALTLRDLSGSKKHPSLETPPTKRHWVRLTRVCNDKCNFCLDSEAQNGTSLPVHAIMADLQKGRDMGLTRVVLSGGEPTVHPDYVDIVRKTREIGYTHVQTVTNGRRMFYKDFLLDCVKAGLTEVTFSLHGHTPELHDSQTGSPGSFLQGLVALRNALKIEGLIVSVDTVISKQNVRHLREILDFFIKQGVREFDLLQVIPFGAAWENQEKLFYDVDAELPHLHRALDLSKRGDIVIWTNRLKPQYLEGFEDLIQPPSKLHDEYKGRGLMFENFLKLGMKPTCWGRCKHCFLENSCRDIETLQSKGQLAGYLVPECLKDHPENIVSESPDHPEMLNHDSNLPMKTFVDFYIKHRYFVKGTACKSCVNNDTCSGVNVEHARRLGFPKPKPWMIVSAQPNAAAKALDQAAGQSWSV